MKKPTLMMILGFLLSIAPVYAGTFTPTMEALKKLQTCVKAHTEKTHTEHELFIQIDDAQSQASQSDNPAKREAMNVSKASLASIHSGYETLKNHLAQTLNHNSDSTVFEHVKKSEGHYDFEYTWSTSHLVYSSEIFLHQTLSPYPEIRSELTCVTKFRTATYKE